MAQYQTGKHPLFVAIATPLYHGARKVYQAILPEPFAENLALSFPVAVMGALNALVTVLLFQRIGFRPWPATILTAFYAGSATIVVFASFPDSYMASTLFTNLFLLIWLREQSLRRWVLLAVLTALAGLCAPQQLIVMIAPVVTMLRSGLAGREWLQTVRYGSSAVILHLVPFLTLMLFVTKGAVAGFMVDEAKRWANVWNVVEPQWWGTVGGAFLVLAVAIPAPLDLIESLRLEAFLPYPGFWGIGLAIGIYAVWGWLRSRASQCGPYRAGLAAYCLAYWIFFVWWMPTEAFLYSAPVLLPIWVLLHGNWLGDQDRRPWQIAMGAAAILVWICSLLLLWEAREREDYRRVSLRDGGIEFTVRAKNT